MSNFILAELVVGLPTAMEKIQRQVLTTHHQVLRTKKNAFVQKRQRRGLSEKTGTKVAAHNIMRGGS